MVTIEDKLRLFSKIVYDKMDEELSREIEKFEKEKSEILDKEKKAIERQRKKLLKEINKKSQIKAKEKISKSKFQMRKDLLELRENIIDSTLEDIIVKLREFVNCEKYKEYLYKEIGGNIKDLDTEEFILYLTEKDFYSCKEKLENKFNIEVRYTNEDIIGGGIFKNKNNKIRIDCSLYNKVKNRREKIGIRITELISQ